MIRLIASILLLLVAQGVVAAQDGQPNHIEQIDIRLYYHHSGKLSAPINDRIALWNVIIGEGGAEEPSTSTLLNVVVKGVPGAYKSKLKVYLDVTEARSGKSISRQSKDIGVFSPDGKYHVGFWLPNTGCEPLRVVARIQGGKQSVVQVPFKCGE